MTMKIKLENIKIDHKNPRYPYSETIEQQVKSMLKHQSEKIIFLLKDILDRGLSPLVNIGVINEKGNWIVVDGNRRILALKIFSGEFSDMVKALNPFFYDELKFLQNRYNKAINFYQEILVVDLVDRKNAAVWLERLHGTSQKGAATLQWDTYANNKYSHDVLKQEKIPIAILDTAISKNIVGATIYYEVKSYTVIERLFSDPTITSWLGFNHKTKQVSNQTKFKRIKHVLEKAKNINLQSVYSKKNRIDFIIDIEKQKSIKPEVMAIDIKNNKPKKRTKSSTIKTNWKFTSNDETKLIDEINKINFEQLPRYGVGALRMILESKITAFENFYLIKKQNDLKKKLDACLNYAQKKKMVNDSTITNIWTSVANNNYINTLHNVIHNAASLSLDKKIILKLISITKEILEILVILDIDKK